MNTTTIFRFMFWPSYHLSTTPNEPSNTTKPPRRPFPTFFRTCFFHPPLSIHSMDSLNFHTSPPPKTTIFSFPLSSNLIPSSFTSSTHHLQPSVTHSDTYGKNLTPILILKFHPTTTSTTPPTISNSLLEHHQTPQTPPNSSYIPSKHLSNPPRTIKHDFQHHWYAPNLEFQGTLLHTGYYGVLRVRG